MENQDQVKTANPLKEYMSGLIIFLAILAGVVIYKFVLGNPDNFEGGDVNNHPKVGNILGIVYKGGFLVPVALGMLIMLIAFTIERFLTLTKAAGKGSMDVFVQQLQSKLEAGDIAGAMASCDEQAGSVGNVMKAALKKYAEMEKDQKLDKEQKVLAIQKALEEATALELPMLEK
ncbi:MAG: MotA/TolQ/ExbB proton channel family protein, partial [Bacteroidia bacterium]|nr:MotA/TolQ/ExbB proton channel family protein [Bacteroidia bacterium]